MPRENAVALVHTHSFEDGERIPAGVCQKFPSGGLYDRGPSKRDTDLEGSPEWITGNSS